MVSPALRMAVAAAAATVLLGSMTTATVAETAYVPGSLDWPKVPSSGVSPSSTYYGFEIKDDFRFRNGFVSVATPAFPSCTGLDDPQCADGVSGKAPWHVVRILPPCSETTPGDDCIQSISMTVNGETRDAKLRQSLPGITWNADAQRGFPSGHTSSLWENPFEPGRPLHALVYGNVRSSASKWRLTDFSATVTPTHPTTGKYTPMYRFKGDDGVVRAVGGIPPECEWATETQCGLRAPFPGGASIQMKLRLPREITGFLTGRLEEPNIEILPIADGQNLLSVSAAPMTVGMVGIKVPVEDLPPTMAAEERAKYKWNCGPDGCVSGGSANAGGVEYWAQTFERWRPWLKDSLTIELPTWSVSRPEVSNLSSPCLAKDGQLVGLVTTTSTAYQGDPPTWDGQSLTYKVASMHYRPDGKSVQKGRYYLVLRSDVARCLYGFSNAPVSATVSVVSENGEASVATTVVGERNGWLSLAATNFTYSAPTIKVTLTGEKAKPAAVEPTTAASAPKQQKQTIVCNKGKATKKVTATNPKCPNGWKKKS